MTTRRPRVTSTDVARAAGVSQSAVSRAFTPGASVAPKTRKRVVAAATKLGYRPNAIARSLITRRTKLVGIVMAHLTNPFYPPVLERFSRKLEEHGRRVLLITLPGQSHGDAALPEILQYQVDSLVLTSATLSSAMAEECARLGMPVVLFNRTASRSRVSAVCCDNEAAGSLAADLFLDAGDRHLGYLAGTANSSTNLERERGFFDRVAARKAPKPKRAAGDYDYETAFAASRALLAAKSRPTALLCANDVMAFAAIDAARGLGLRVPRDLSVLAVDDSAMARWRAYDLTTIRQPVEAMVDATVDLLLGLEEGRLTGSVVRRLPGELIVRSSVRMP
ncbi:MAG: substrate-binding domain-containing protein [Alphaproteobacteria bacterium]|nr:substrate-binding domain-containing protein [Alphaproteobacteria bacterium]